MENEEKMQYIMNLVYPGITMFARDVDLEPTIINKYKANILIREKAYVDCTHKIGGIKKNTRFIILSNDIRDISEFENGTNWGLCVANRDSYFKVLETKKISNKNLIILLHVPKEYITFFESSANNIDEMLIEKAINRFKECLNSKHINDLTDEWYSRLNFPIGMDDDGLFWSLD